MAAQFTLMKGPERRDERWWMARATSSLPVPVSPVMSTVTSTRAASRRICRASSILGLAHSSISRPIRPSEGSGAGTSDSVWTRTSLSIACWRSSSRSGLSRIASTSSGSAAWPLVRRSATAMIGPLLRLRALRSWNRSSAASSSCLESTSVKQKALSSSSSSASSAAETLTQ